MPRRPPRRGGGDRRRGRSTEGGRPGYPGLGGRGGGRWLGPRAKGSRDASREGYLEDGRLSPDAMALLFAAAAELYRTAPWEWVDAEQTLRVDLPDLGVIGAAVCVLGKEEGTEPGLLICPSKESWERFLEVAETQPEPQALFAATTPGWLALSYQERRSLPEAHRREAEEHGWPVAGRRAWPVIDTGTPPGGGAPLQDRDLWVATACASAATAFCVRNRALFSAEPGEEVEPASMVGEEEEVGRAIITAPYEAFDAFDWQVDLGNLGEADLDALDEGEDAYLEDPELDPPGLEPELAPGPIRADTLAHLDAPPPEPGGPRPAAGPSRRRAGRNDPCPCGSGRKYKRCCLAADERRLAPVAAGKELEDGAQPIPPEPGEGATSAPRRHPLHEVENRLVERLVHWAEPKLGEAWLAYLDDFLMPAAAESLAVPWSVYGFPVRGKTVLERYLEARAHQLPADERRLAAAQRSAWLSVWEVSEVRPGEGATLRDLLSHEERTVHDLEAARSLYVDDAILARVIDHEGVSLLCGVHPQPLPPGAAADLVRRARGRLRRKRAVPVERLRDPDFARYLIRRWEEDVHALAGLRAPQELRTGEGDPFLLITDHFRVRPEARQEVARRLAGLPDVDPPEADEDPPVWVFLAPAEEKRPAPGLRGRSVLGHATLERDALRVETHSTRRADLLRARVEEACGEFVRHRAREHADPLSEARRGDPAPPPPEPTPEQQQLVLDFKRQHYADWPDQPLPALGGRTAREAAQTAEGRRAVDLLLKDMQNMEARMAGDGPAYDFSWIRRDLGLE